VGSRYQLPLRRQDLEAWSVVWGVGGALHLRGRRGRVQAQTEVSLLVKRWQISHQSFLQHLGRVDAVQVRGLCHSAA
jgi:hypothetical protein